MSAVIDPNDAEAIERLTILYNRYAPGSAYLAAMRAAVRDFAAEVKP